MSKNKKYPHLKELFHQDKNAYAREWRKLNPKYNQVKDEWRKLDDYTYNELPLDVIPVPNFPSYYVRENGEVWRDTRGLPSAVKTGKERVLKLRSTYIPKSGYWLVQPYLDGKRKAIYLHRFILTAFKGEAPELGMECHHIDNDTSNNSISNLMWVTRQENIDYSHHNMFRPKMKLEEGRQVSNSKHSHLHPEIVRLHKIGIRPVDIASKVNIPTATIYQVIKSLKRRGQL
jgi:hypothetical protein